MDAGHELSPLISTTSSRSRSKSAFDQIHFFNAAEEGRSCAHVQDSSAAVRTHKRTSRWPDNLIHGDGLGRHFSLHNSNGIDSPLRGWRRTITFASAATGVILLINTILTIVGSLRYPIDSEGTRLLYSGDCDRVKRWDIVLHLLINLLGTTLLAASSFTMQCLSSPTRSEVDAAHAKRVSLDIGVPSFTNLFYIRCWKAIIWLLLCLSTIPLHLLWNSTIFTTLPRNYYSVVVADQTFLQGAAYSQVNDSVVSTCYGSYFPCLQNPSSIYTCTPPKHVAATLYDGYKSGRYSNLTASECLDVYSGDIGSTRRNLIVIVQQPVPSDRLINCGFTEWHSIGHGMSERDEPLMWNGSSVVGITINVSTNELTKKLWPRPSDNWMGRFSNNRLPTWEDLQNESKSIGTWPLADYRVESCLSENTTSMPCDLHFLPSVLYIVIACNAIKLICMCLTARYLWHQERQILATIGDAVASFLERPDETTKGLCLMDHRDRKRGVLWQSYNPIYNREPYRRLYFASTNLMWWATVIVCASFLTIGWFLWSIPFTHRFLTFKESMRLDFGSINPLTVFTIDGLRGNIFGDIFIANISQIVLSIAYFLYNSLWTAQCSALEWTSYIQGEKKGLRVTCPDGQQRSTYYLELPYRYSIPLITSLVSMHFLVSRSAFLVRIQEYNWVGDRINDYNGFRNQLIYSPRAIFTTCTIGTILVLLQIAHAHRLIDNRIPTHGNNSAVLSAMCHPGRCDENELASSGLPSNVADHSGISLRPVMWGVTRQPDAMVDGSSMGLDPARDGAGHCSFSADTVDLPEKGKKYR